MCEKREKEGKNIPLRFSRALIRKKEKITKFLKSFLCCIQRVIEKFHNERETCQKIAKPFEH